MNPRAITERVAWVGVVDWDRRLFDSLIPLPDGTSYNAYLVRGSEKVALIDTVDPSFAPTLLDFLGRVPRVDYVVANHAEQDHAGSLGFVLERYPAAKVVCTPKCKALLIDELHIPEDRFLTVENGATLSLGDRTLEFLHLPWVHWPETMVTYLREENLLFSCDLFGSHLAANALYVNDEGTLFDPTGRGRVYEAAKRYYAEIMIPFRGLIQKHLATLGRYDIRMVLPSHGPIHRKPEFIVDAYRDWASDTPKNVAVVPYISMHGSTRQMVERFIDALTERGVKVERFDLAATDLGKLAMALVDGATVVIGTPTVLAGPHPAAAYAAYLANALRPKTRFASVIGSYGWGGRTVDTLAGMLTNLKVEMLPPVLIKGAPRMEDLRALDALADAVAAKHRAAGLMAG